MGLLSKRTISATPGVSYVNSPGGFSFKQILCVKREGLQYDKVAYGNINNGTTRQWAYDPFRRRIKFPDAVPFNTGEKVFVIYKNVL